MYPGLFDAQEPARTHIIIKKARILFIHLSRDHSCLTTQCYRYPPKRNCLSACGCSDDSCDVTLNLLTLYVTGSKMCRPLEISN